MIKVQSANIRAVDYDKAKKELSILFVNSSDIYVYRDVSNQRYTAFMAAESKGTYFHANIKNQYSFRKVKKKG